jgi:flagellar basal-body rod protein FlgG
MIRAMHTAATGMEAQQERIDVLSNNLANVNTTGFKKQRADFQDLLYQTVRAPGTTSAQGTLTPTGVQIGTGVRTSSTHRSFSPGDPQQTGNPLDLSIQGNGFFQVTLPGGQIGYTRAGNFELDQQGQIVTTDGYLLDPSVAVPQGYTSLSIGSDGTVSATMSGESAPSEVGQIQLVNFVNPGGLQSIGRNFYQATSASGDPVTGTPGLEGLGGIQQGMLEMSNVKVVDEMIDLIASQRAYDINSKVIQASDEMLQTTTNVT